jgi:hypothetical protein
MDSNMKIAQYILDSIGIKYTDQIPFNARLAVDDVKTSTYNLIKLKKYLHEDGMRDLYTKLLITWLLHTEPLDRFQWGVNADGTLTNVILNQPFEKAFPHVKYFCKNNLSASPINMILLGGDDLYFKVACQIYDTIEQKRQDIDAYILKTTVACQDYNSKAQEMFSGSMRELSTYIKEVS